MGLHGCSYYGPRETFEHEDGDGQSGCLLERDVGLRGELALLVTAACICDCCLQTPDPSLTIMYSSGVPKAKVLRSGDGAVEYLKGPTAGRM